MDFSRRTFMKVAVISGTTLAADSGVKHVEKLVPYVKPPEWTPVKWHAVATTCRECPAGCGMHVLHRDGRITKAEGNPVHPVNRGGLCARGQSALQGIYDPDRVSGVHARDDRDAHFGRDTWENAFAKIGARLRNGRGRVAVISRLETGTLAGIMSSFAAAFGSDRVLLYEAFNHEPLRKAHAAFFGSPVIPYYRLDACDYIMSFGADFLESWVSNVQFAWQFAEMHELKNGRIGRFDYVGPRLSMTAANADRFILTPPGGEKDVAFGMLRIMQEEGRVRAGNDMIRSLTGNFDLRSVITPLLSVDELRKMARRFSDAGTSIALGPPLGANGPDADQLAMAITLLNIAAGRSAQSIDFTRPHALSKTASSRQFQAFLQSLTPEDVLIIHKTNPVYTRPGSEEFIQKAGLVVYLGTLLDETAAIADWLLPMHDDLETWGDYEPWAGIQSIMQPTMAPVADSAPFGDVLLRLASSGGKTLRTKADGSAVLTTYDWMQEQRGRAAGIPPLSDEIKRKGGAWTGFDAPGRTALPPLKQFSVPVSRTVPTEESRKDQADLWLWASVMLFDGRTANRGWIQEAPEPVSTVIWNSWIDIHPKKAAALGIEDDNIIELTARDNRSVQAPARITEQVAEETVALCFGQGHSAMGSNAGGVGTNAFRLIPASQDSPGYFGRVTIRNTGRNEKLIREMPEQNQHDRELLRWVDFEAAKTMKPGPLTLPLPEGYSRERDLYEPHVHNFHRWAMTIDLQRCIGCGACSVACYAENNLAVVGKEALSGEQGILREIGKAGLRGVKEGRSMSWLRIAPYRHENDPLRLGFLPMPCQHCDSAPCEPVCPVFAAVNNEEGLNAQIYNRCIGTRYCSNNCPYKVRRFNWFNTYWKPPLDLQLNPEVTARSRGVMEKCTFCIQRIRHAEFQAKRENRKVRDGEVQPACVQSCPAKVFTFGDLKDPESKVSRITRNHPRRYHVLEELNTKPAVTYLFRILQEETE